MTAPLTDGDLGARLRSALQELTPLVTDPVPTPRFAPTVAPGVDQGIAPDGAADAEVIEIGGPRSPRPATGWSRRRTALAAGVLVAAAAVTAVVLTTDLDRGSGPAPVAPAASISPVPVETATIPDRDGAYLGLTPDPIPWRCTAPAGTTIAATMDLDQFRPIVWTVAAGVTCAPFPADEKQFAFGEDGEEFGIGVLSPAYVVGRGSEFCAYAATQNSGREPSFVSRGAADYLEFAGPGCRLVLPPR